jgi:transposase
VRQRKVLPTANERLDARQKKCVPIMAEFKVLLDDLAPKLPPKVPLAKAVHHALGEWQKLSVYLTEPIVPLDNNRCENAIRPFLKNDSFCTSFSSI